MRSRIGTWLGLTLTLSVVIASGVHADVRNRRGLPRFHPPTDAFTISGSCTGMDEGEIRVDGTTYRLDPEARIFEIGRGFVPATTSLNYRTVILTGVKVRNTMVVRSVLIRPDFNPVASAGRSGPARVEDPSAHK